MSHVVGIDLSTRAIDLVKLAENDNTAEWVRCELAGKTAWERALDVPRALRAPDGRPGHAYWWDDVYLVAIETPVNDQRRVLRLIQGAAIASLPAKLRQPHSCWDVHPSTWKAGLGLKGKPAWEDVRRISGGRVDILGTSYASVQIGVVGYTDEIEQNARDAYCLAMYTRDLNARAVAAALGETA